MSTVLKIGSDREHRLLLYLMLSRYQKQMRRTMLRPTGPMQHEEVQRMYQKLCQLNETTGMKLNVVSVLRANCVILHPCIQKRQYVLCVRALCRNYLLF